MSDPFSKGKGVCSNVAMVNHSICQEESNSSVQGQRSNLSVTSSCDDDADSGLKRTDTCCSAPPMLNATQSVTQMQDLSEGGDTNDNYQVIDLPALEDGDAISTNSSTDTDDVEEVVSNLRIQRVGVVGRSFKRRRIRD